MSDGLHYDSYDGAHGKMERLHGMGLARWCVC